MLKMSRRVNKALALARKGFLLAGRTLFSAHDAKKNPEHIAKKRAQDRPMLIHQIIILHVSLIAMKYCSSSSVQPLQHCPPRLF